LWALWPGSVAGGGAPSIWRWNSSKAAFATWNRPWNTGLPCSSAMCEPQPSMMSWSSHIITLGTLASSAAVSGWFQRSR
jgi:hypothetical protein